MTDKADNEQSDKPGQPTLDGRRLGLSELNLGVKADLRKAGWLRRFLYKLSQFLAGMYTGESCAGTPHAERQQEAGGQENRQNKENVSGSDKTGHRL